MSLGNLLPWRRKQRAQDTGSLVFDQERRAHGEGTPEAAKPAPPAASAPPQDR